MNFVLRRLPRLRELAPESLEFEESSLVGRVRMRDIDFFNGSFGTVVAWRMRGRKDYVYVAIIISVIIIIMITIIELEISSSGDVRADFTRS